MRSDSCWTRFGLALALIFFGVSTGVAHARVAQTQRLDGLVDGTTLQPAVLTQVLSNVKPGSVVIVGEIHNNFRHHDNEIAVMNALSSLGLKVSVGLEFFEARHQNLVDLFLEQNLTEAEFTRLIAWRGQPFSDYRRQALYARQSGGRTLALNAPRELTTRISQVGIKGLTAAEAALLPPEWRIGNALYRERFNASMKNHVPAAALERYFEAQSTWDETMAHSVRLFQASPLGQQPDSVLVVVVGDFHAAYGGGLPDRLRARGAPDVHVLSQLSRTGLTDEALRAEAAPHPLWGARADWIWITD